MGSAQVLGLFDDVNAKLSWPSDVISHFRQRPRGTNSLKNQSNMMQNPREEFETQKPWLIFESISCDTCGKIRRSC